MIKITRKYKQLPLLLAFLMFFSSIGYSIDFHYCHGQLKNVSLFGKAESCHQTSSKNSCSFHNTAFSCCQSQEKEDDCCNNETEYLQLDIDYTSISIDNNEDFNNNYTFKINSSLISYINPFFLNFQNYIPPLLDVDIPIVIQQFRL